MWTEHIFAIWILELHQNHPIPSLRTQPPPHTHTHIHKHPSFPTDRSKAIPLLQFFFVCVSVMLYVAFVVSLFVPHLSFPFCPGRVVSSIGRHYVPIVPPYTTVVLVLCSISWVHVS